ncbi:MAG: HD domain-containing protein [Solirubrobacteraceae bacterium MAG38_C4-C5]|nr:HD domain-containing protein [Candidatus Siliceabacter maunaloa]
MTANPPGRRLSALIEVAHNPTVATAVEGVRRLLDLDIAYATFHESTEQVFLHVEGDGEAFGVHEGLRVPLEATYCKRILAGELPPVIPDTLDDPVAAELPGTRQAGIRAFASVPLTRADGSLFGTLCCAGLDAHPELGERDLQFMHVFARLVVDTLERDEQERMRRELEARAAGLDALVAAIEARDAYTAEHSRTVVRRATEVARRLSVDAATVEDVGHVALLHDVGKVAMPDALLRKPGPLSEEEWRLMRRHPIESERIVAAVPSLAHLGPAVRAEHEHWDGGGYPDGLAAEVIPIAARIVLACDAYDAMMTDRPYRAARGHDVAVRELATGSGSQFDPDVAATLLEVLSEETAGHGYATIPKASMPAHNGSAAEDSAASPSGTPRASR